MSEQTPKIEKAEWIGASKKSLFDKFNKLVDTINSETVTSTADVISKREDATTVASANSIVSDIAGIRTSAESAMDAIVVMSDQYQNLNAAITSKRKELKDILGFEVEANSTIALVTAKDAILVEKTAEAATIIANAKAEAKDIISAANQEASQMKAEQERKSEEWDYKFKRSSQESEDTLQDTLDGRIKAVDLRVSEVAAREDVADTKDTLIESLQEELVEVNASIVEQIATAIESEKTSIAKSAAVSKGFSDRAHKQDLEMKDLAISGLESKVSDISGQLSKSTELVATANASVSTMAVAALTAQGDAQTIAKVAEVAAGGGKRN